MSFLYILNINSISFLEFVNIFLQFILLVVSFAMQEFPSLM